MLELTSQEVDVVSGAKHDAAEACLVGGGAMAAVGSFFSPFGSAVGGLGGCAAGLLVYYMM